MLKCMRESKEYDEDVCIRWGFKCNESWMIAQSI